MNKKLTKNQIIRKKEEFKLLMSKGKTVKVFPFYVKYLIVSSNNEFNIKAAFSVRKKNFKQAVKRNYIKRVTKDLFRNNRDLLIQNLSQRNLKILILFVYDSSKIETFLTFKDSVIEIFSIINKRVNL